MYDISTMCNSENNVTYRNSKTLITNDSTMKMKKLNVNLINEDSNLYLVSGNNFYGFINHKNFWVIKMCVKKISFNKEVNQFQRILQ